MSTNEVTPRFGNYAALEPSGSVSRPRQDVGSALCGSRWRFRPPVLAVIDLAPAGLPRELFTEALRRISPVLSDSERIEIGADGRLVLVLQGGREGAIRARLEDMTLRALEAVADRGVVATPVVGWVRARRRAGEADLERLLTRAGAAADASAQHLDLVPRRWRSLGSSRPRLRAPDRLRTAAELMLSAVVGLGIPFAILAECQSHGIEIITPVYLAAVLALVITASTIWVEGLHALRPPAPPERPAAPYPAASAIIPAYLPNEADTILDTVRSVLAQRYPGPLQVVLAYNTPRDMPVEADLRRVAEEDPRFIPLRVEHSTSKAQNVNAALDLVRGEFTAVFDADHQPAPDAFRRAWHWIAEGMDVVQGHCVIRNGEASWVARTVAVEFETIYAVSHPGRNLLHGFGLFCGSNGFWRTDLLRQVRMRSEMLTEDIDCSIRTLLRGRRLVNDPGLLSRELAPATAGALWNQRLRWAQGWSQVSRRHLGRGLRSDRISLRNKMGLLFLLGWREVYPWLSLQMLPVIAYLVWRHGLNGVEMAVPIFIGTTICALSVGPGQVLLSYLRSAPELRRRRSWFWGYMVLSALFYSEFKNVIARVAHIREITGRRRWVVTPRAVPGVE